MSNRWHFPAWLRYKPLECYSEASEWFEAVVSSHTSMSLLGASNIVAADKEEEAVGELLCWIYSIRKISWLQ